MSKKERMNKQAKKERIAFLWGMWSGLMITTAIWLIVSLNG